jgi:hypothetical protein
MKKNAEKILFSLKKIEKKIKKLNGRTFWL